MSKVHRQDVDRVKSARHTYALEKRRALADGKVSAEEAAAVGDAGKRVVDTLSHVGLEADLKRGGWSPSAKAKREREIHAVAAEVRGLAAQNPQAAEQLEQQGNAIERYVTWNEGVRTESPLVQRDVVRADHLVASLEAFAQNPKNAHKLKAYPLNTLAWLGPKRPAVGQFMGAGPPAILIRSRFPAGQYDSQHNEAVRRALRELISTEPALEGVRDLTRFDFVIGDAADRS